MSEQPTINRAYVLLATALAEIEASGYIAKLQIHARIGQEESLRDKAARRLEAIRQLKNLLWDLGGDWQ